jgi:hypothetical protein
MTTAGVPLVWPLWTATLVQGALAVAVTGYAYLRAKK